MEERKHAGLRCTVEMLEIDIGKHQVSNKRTAWAMHVEEGCGRRLINGDHAADTW